MILKSAGRTDDDVHAAARYDATAVGETEIAFKPARVVLQDFTGVPCVVDLPGILERLPDGTRVRLEVEDTGTGIAAEDVDYINAHGTSTPANDATETAAIKAVPDELLEAARVDGASEVQAFWRVIVPQITPTILVVLTTLIIIVMKVFDLVKATTNGNNNSATPTKRVDAEKRRSTPGFHSTASKIPIASISITSSGIGMTRGAL